MSYTGPCMTFCLERDKCHTRVPVIHFVWTNKIPDKIQGVIHGCYRVFVLVQKKIPRTFVGFKTRGGKRNYLIVTPRLLRNSNAFFLEEKFWEYLTPPILARTR